MTPPRPLHNSPALRDAVVAALIDDVSEWLSEGLSGFADVMKRFGRLELQLKTVVGAYNLNGYILAKILERDFSWRPDAKLVEILDRAAQERDLAYNDAVITWAALNNIKPKYKIGDHVYITVERREYRGVIVALKTDVAQYAVSVPDLGHVYSQEKGGDYLAIDYEKLEAKQRLDQDVVPEDGVSF